MSTTLVAQVAPQRSTQYDDMVTALAPHELALSNVGEQLSGEITPIKMGSRTYLRLDLASELDNDLLLALSGMAMTDAYFHHYDRIGDVDGPFLKPIEVDREWFLPPSLAYTQRYTGKTNELLTQMMCNIARYSSNYRNTPWNKLTLLDPLAGGGTTLFVGLMFGADVAGVEQDKKVVDGTIAFLKHYVGEGRIPAKFREDRLKSIGKRSFITLKQSARCVVGRGDTRDVSHFVNGLKRPQLIVTDLPYGIQHQADWQTMLTEALPKWADVLADGGAMAFSWNATRLPRDAMIDLVQGASAFTVMNDPPYNQLSHRVDRVIKQRDVIVARLSG
jgi:hypothetical protein